MEAFSGKLLLPSRETCPRAGTTQRGLGFFYGCVAAEGQASPRDQPSVPLGCPPQHWLVPAGGKGRTRAASVWHPHASPAPQKPWGPLLALGRGSGSAQVPHQLHHDHPAAPGEGGMGGRQQWLVGDAPWGVSFCPPCVNWHVPKDVSLLCVPRPRASGWPSTQCGNTAQMKRWWPRPKSSSRTGSGCWVSDGEEKQELTPPSPNSSWGHPGSSQTPGAL